MDENMVFPPVGEDGFPPCCPPTDAVDADGVVYRATISDPPVENDFSSQHELGLRPSLKSSWPQKCSMRAVSVYRTLRDAQHHLNTFQKYKFIAVGVLTPGSGKAKLAAHNDRPTHSNWWCYVEFNQDKRLKLFKTYQVA